MERKASSECETISQAILSASCKLSANYRPDHDRASAFYTEDKVEFLSHHWPVRQHCSVGLPVVRVHRVQPHLTLW